MDVMRVGRELSELEEELRDVVRVKVGRGCCKSESWK